MLEDILYTCPFELSNTLCHMLDNQNEMDFERHVELSNPLPYTRDKKDKDNYNYNLLGCLQTIFTRILNNVCLISHFQLYSVHSYKPKKLINLFLMSPRAMMFD